MSRPVIWWIGLPLRFSIAVIGIIPYSMICGYWRGDLFREFLLGDEAVIPLPTAKIVYYDKEFVKDLKKSLEEMKCPKN